MILFYSPTSTVVHKLEEFSNFIIKQQLVNSCLNAFCVVFNSWTIY